MNSKRCIFIFIFTIFFAGCTPKTGYPSDNHFYLGTDFQHTWTATSQERILTESEDGYYCILLRDSIYYLYFIDKATMKIVPLCNKPNCLHDQETEDEKIIDCNAYLYGNSFYTNLNFMDGKLYLVPNDQEQTVVLQMEPDGSNRKELYRINGKTHGSHTAFHRGMLYISFHIYTQEMEAASEIWAYPLNTTKKSPEKLGTFSINKGGLDELKVQGNFLYTKALSSKSDERMQDNIYRIDLTHKKIFEQFILEDSETVYGLSFSGDTVFSGIGKNQGAGSYVLNLSPMEYRRTDLEGKNQGIWKEDLYQEFASDDTYFYLWSIPHGDLPEKDRKLVIYDKGCNEVVRFSVGETLPQYNTFYISPGEDIFILTKDQSLYYFPKSEIGSGNITPVLLIEGV